MAEHLIEISRNTYEALQQELRELRQLVANSKQKSSQEQIGLFIEYTPAAIAVFDRQMRYLLASQRWREDYGLGNQDIIGRSHYEIFPEIPQSWREIHQRCLCGNIERCDEDTFIRADGTTDWVKWEIHPWYENSGEVGGIIMFTEVITNRKQAEIALANSERRLRDIASNLPGAIFQFTNRHGVWQVDYISDFIEELAGITAKDMIEDCSCFFDLIHSEDWESFVISVNQAVENATPWHYEGRLIKPNGEIRWWQGDSTPTVNEQGEVIFCGVLLDITNRKQAEAELKRLNEKLEARVEERTTALLESETRLQRLADNVPGMLYEFHLQPDGTMSFPYVSSGCREITEREPKELQDNPSLTLSDVHPDDISYVQAAIADSAKTLHNFGNEWRIITPSGKQKWIKANSKPERRIGGEIVWYGYMLDISERKTVEALLQEQEEFLRSIYEGADQIIFVVDVLENCEFRYAGWNTTAETASGINRAEVIGKAPEDVHGMIEGAAVRQRYRNCVETGIPNSYEECLTIRNQSTWWLTKINPLQNSEGKIYRLVGTTLNITERKKAEIQLQQQAKSLENALRELQRTQTQLIQSEKMSSLGNMVAGIAHEINNPVNFIHGNLIPASEYAHDLLHLVQLYQIHFPYPPAEIQEVLIDIDFEFLQEDLVKLLTSMRVGTQRIREIVLSLRNFSRLDEAEFKQVDIHEGIDSTLMILQNRLKSKPGHPEILVIKEYGNLPLIDCYPGQLNQVFMNIISNAIDALEDSFIGEQAQIHICSEVINSNWVSIKIADNGAGIPVDVVDKLFDPFFTTKSVGKGTGLGLSISYQIVVDRHGGKLSCHSQPGQGAEFMIEIPISQNK
ncbi:PAS domain-containing sensor histidine kinase [Anabaena sp. CA = ATCC 33047]|uniref:PAS domain-containing sensor histidine kinase n=1 Tax=Anabaena sp. (strain CA / ATCC 33047) TaxID=52271 RepID=UPI000835A6CB|nr:PAS domain S-box protein [Anabaena sp. CA = ATCC 33047]